MENTVRSCGYLAISVPHAGGNGLYGLKEQRAQRVERNARMAAAAFGQRVGQVARKREYIDDTRAAALATMAGMSGLRAWSAPV